MLKRKRDPKSGEKPPKRLRISQDPWNKWVEETLGEYVNSKTGKVLRITPSFIKDFKRYWKEDGDSQYHEEMSENVLISLIAMLEPIPELKVCSLGQDCVHVTDKLATQRCLKCEADYCDYAIEEHECSDSSEDSSESN